MTLPSGVFNTTYQSDMAIVRTKTQWFLLAVAIILLFAVPQLASSYWLAWLTRLAITIVALLGLHILTGLCGLFSIGHAAFIGVGAYTVAILTTRFGVSPWACLPLCGLSAGLVGLVFGLPCFRLKGFYLAISTLAGSFIILWCLQYFDSLTGGYSGIALSPLRLGGMDLSSHVALYCLSIATVLAAAFFAKNIQRMSTGRAFVAIRDNELAARVSGINVFRQKMLAFFIGCALAGVAGWLWANSQMRVAPDQFRLDDSIWYVGMLIVGGIGSTTGVFFGAVAIRGLEVIIDHLNPALARIAPDLAMQFNVATSLILFGGLAVAFLIFEPRGMHHLWERLRTYVRVHPYSYRGR
jgi:branched-chain amino acid transport system permease protein